MRRERKLHIAFVVSVFPAVSETFILNQICGLLDRGCEVDIFARLEGDTTQVHPEVERYGLQRRTHRLPSPPAGKRACRRAALGAVSASLARTPLRTVRLLRHLLRQPQGFSYKLLFSLLPLLRRRYDLIHCHFGNNALPLVELKAAGLPIPLLTTFHGQDVNRYPQAMGEDVYAGLFRRGDLFTANTGFTRQRMIDLGGPAERIIVHPVGLQPEKFVFRPRALKPGEPVRILSVGRLVEKKGIEYALRAVAAVKEQGRRVRYTIVGEGPLRDSLGRLAVELGLESVVEFLGPLDGEGVRRQYERAHLFLLPCVTAADGDREGQGLVLQEAQAVGLPVLSTIHNGIPEGVLADESACLVPERDVQALAGRLDWLIENPAAWPEMGRRGSEFVRDKYDIDRLNDELLEVYSRLL